MTSSFSWQHGSELILNIGSTAQNFSVTERKFVKKWEGNASIVTTRACLKVNLLQILQRSVRTKLLFWLPKIHHLAFAMDCKYMSLIIMAKSFIDLWVLCFILYANLQLLLGHKMQKNLPRSFWISSHRIRPRRCGNTLQGTAFNSKCQLSFYAFGLSLPQRCT